MAGIVLAGGTLGDGCQCRSCRKDYLNNSTKTELPLDVFKLSAFIVCSECQNKRCPHATDHRLNCTGSNDTGQVGSSYT